MHRLLELHHQSNRLSLPLSLSLSLSLSPALPLALSASFSPCSLLSVHVPFPGKWFRRRRGEEDSDPPRTREPCAAFTRNHREYERGERSTRRGDSHGRDVTGFYDYTKKVFRPSRGHRGIRGIAHITHGASPGVTGRHGAARGVRWAGAAREGRTV